MSIHPKLCRFTHKLNEIEKRARKLHADNTANYFQYIVEEYTRYWRYLQHEHMDAIQQNMWNELYFIFNDRLYEYARCRLDMMYLVFEIDDQPLFHDEHVRAPFWRN